MTKLDPQVALEQWKDGGCEECGSMNVSTEDYTDCSLMDCGNCGEQTTFVYSEEDYG